MQYRHLKWLEYLSWLLGKSILRFSRRSKNQTVKLSQKKLQRQNTTINLSWLHIQSVYTSLFILLYEQGRVNIFSLFCFLEIDIREQKKHEKRIQTSVDNTFFWFDLRNIILLLRWISYYPLCIQFPLSEICSNVCNFPLLLALWISNHVFERKP